MPDRSSKPWARRIDMVLVDLLVVRLSNCVEKIGRSGRGRCGARGDVTKLFGRSQIIILHSRKILSSEGMPLNEKSFELLEET